MTEHEKKRLLTKDEYEYLMEHFQRISPLYKRTVNTQINYYFDTEDLSMTQKNITCRIRLSNGQYKAIMKQHIKDTDRSIETEMEIHNGIDRNAFTNKGLRLFGKMTTERCIVMEVSGCKVVLDKNEYLDTIDYELEVEYDPQNEIVARIIFQYLSNEIVQKNRMREHGETPVILKTTTSKSSRFFDRYTIINQKEQTKFLR